MAPEEGLSDGFLGPALNHNTWYMPMLTSLKFLETGVKYLKENMYFLVKLVLSLGFENHRVYKILNVSCIVNLYVTTMIMTY